MPTLGLIRVVYRSNERSVVFLTRPFTLLRFNAPEYVLEPDRGNVRWQIRGGLLVARRGRRRGCGYLSLDVRREHHHAGVKARRVGVLRAIVDHDNAETGRRCSARDGRTNVSRPEHHYARRLS